MYNNFVQFPPKLFLWRRIILFWQPCRKFFAPSKKFSIKDQKTYGFLPIFSQNVPLDTFWEHRAKNLSLTDQKKEVLESLQNKFSVRKWKSGAVTTILGIPAKQSNFFAQSSNKNLKFRILSKKNSKFLWKTFLRIPDFVWKFIYNQKRSESSFFAKIAEKIGTCLLQFWRTLSEI